MEKFFHDGSGDNETSRVEEYHEPLVVRAELGVAEVTCFVLGNKVDIH